MTSIFRNRAQRGMAMVVVLSMVVLLTVLVSFAITISNQDRGQASKQISNAGIDAALESSLQYSRGLFAANYLTSNHWSNYLSLDYSSPSSISSLETAYPELVVPGLPSNFSCVAYARDDMDEPLGMNDAGVDNNLRIFVGALCTTPEGKTAEISAPLEYNPTATTYSSQGSGGTQGINNYARQQGYR